MMQFNSMYDFWHEAIRREAQTQVLEKLRQPSSLNCTKASKIISTGALLDDSETAQAAENSLVILPDSPLETKVTAAETHKENIDRTTPWATIVRCAERRDRGSFRDASGNPQAAFRYHDPLFVAARMKAAEYLAQSTGASAEECNEELLRRFDTDHTVRRSIVNTVRFFRDADPGWMTECESCGFENEPPWHICAQCKTLRQY